MWKIICERKKCGKCAISMSFTLLVLVKILYFKMSERKMWKNWEKTGNLGIFSKLKKRSLQVFFCFNSYNLKMKRPIFHLIVCQMEMSILESLLNEINVHLNIRLWIKKKKRQFLRFSLQILNHFVAVTRAEEKKTIVNFDRL